MFKTTNKTNGRTRLKLNPENKLMISPVILRFENKQNDNNHKQTKNYSKRNSEQLAEKIYQIQSIVR